MKRLTRLERSAASPAVTHPLHARARALAHMHSHKYTHRQALPHIRREELRPWNARYCVNWCQFLDNCMSIFTQWHLRRMLRRRRKPECTFDGGGGAKGEEEKIVKRLLGNSNEIKWHCVDAHAAPLALCHANCRQQFFFKDTKKTPVHSRHLNIAARVLLCFNCCGFFFVFFLAGAEGQGVGGCGSAQSM